MGLFKRTPKPPRPDPTDNLRTTEALKIFIDEGAETGDIVFQCDREEIVIKAIKRWGIKHPYA